jgi:hypothetical protein
MNKCRRIKSIASFGVITAVLSLTAINEAKAQFTFASDQGANYSGGSEPSWTNNSNAGAGFGNWTISTAGGGSKGAFIGNPSSSGVSGMNSESFGLFANGASDARVFADRSLSSAMQVGDTFSFQWGINWDGGGFGRDKGFRLYTGGAPGSGSQIVDVVNGGSDQIFFNAANVGFGFGTSVMTWTFTYTNSTTLAISANDRDGSGTFTTNLAVTGGVTGFRLYATNLDTGDQRQPYYNLFQNTNSGVYYTSQTEGRALTGTGNLVVSNNSTLTLTSGNSFSGTTTVQQGSTLELNATSGSAAGATTALNVGASTAKLLLSKSDQVNNSATVTLSGGTIQRAGGVSETFGALNLTGDSTLDFGTGAVGNLTFGTYEGGTQPSHKLTVSNFAAGNTLVFGNNVASYLPTGGALSNAYFSFNNGFTYNSSTFTVTAIPEPSTYVAAAGLLAMFFWPVRRRMMKDIKSILGLRPTGRERIEAYRNA